MKNKLFFTLVIALMSIYATATEQRLHPVLKYKTINGKKTNYSEAELKAMLLDESGKYDAVKQKVNEFIAPQLRAKGVNVDAIPEEEWDGVYNRCVEAAHLADEKTWVAGDFTIFGLDDQGNVKEIKPRVNYLGERPLLVEDFRTVCPSVTIPAEVYLISGMCGNPLFPKSTLTNQVSTDEDGSANAQANVTNNIYLPEQGAPAQTQYQNYGGYPTAAGYYYPTTSYASQCYDYQPSCGSSYRFGVSLAFGFLPVPVIYRQSGNCGFDYNPPPIQTVNNTNITNNYNYNYWSYYHNDSHNTTIINPRPTGGGPVDPPNGDGLTATDGGPVNPGGRGVRANFEPLHSNSGQGGKYANETEMVSPRQKNETRNSSASNPRIQTPEVIAPRKENMTFTNNVTSNVNPVQTKTPVTPRGVGSQLKAENITAFNNTTPRNTAYSTNPRSNSVTPKVAVPRSTSFNQSGNGNTFVQPSRNEPRRPDVNQNQPKQYAGTQPRTVQPARTTQPLQPRYQNNLQVSPTPQKVQPRPQYQAPRPQYARQNNSRPAVQSVGMRNTGRPVAMNSSRVRH